MISNVKIDEKNKRQPRWTRQETLTLIQAKDITENGPNKGRKISTLLSDNNNNTEPKWVMISAYCKQQGVDRNAAQCRKRWSNLVGDYRKIKTWEGESFWLMRNDVRKEKKLPVTFDWEVYKVLVGREIGDGVEVVSPLPLNAVAFGGDVVSPLRLKDVAFGDEDEMGGVEVVSPLPLNAVAADDADEDEMGDVEVVKHLPLKAAAADDADEDEMGVEAVKPLPLNAAAADEDEMDGVSAVKPLPIYAEDEKGGVEAVKPLALDVFDAADEDEIGSVNVVSPIPLNAFDVGDEHEMEDVEDEDVAEDLRGEVGNENVSVNVNMNVNGNGDEKEMMMDLVLETKGPMTVKRVLENPGIAPEHSSDALRESWPGISYWKSQEKEAKRRRLSADEPKTNTMEAEVMRVLEANNKMVNDQLDIYNKNIQLDRELRKETTDGLLTALGKLTNVLVKIAEKL